MADKAKIEIETVADDEGLKRLNKSLADGEQKVAEYKAELKDLEKVIKKGGQATEEQTARMKELRQSINETVAENGRLKKSIVAQTAEVLKANNASKSLKDTLSGMVSDKFHVDIDSVISKMTTATGIFTTLAGATVAVGTAIIKSGRDVSELSNQFIAFAGNTRDAVEMYNKFNAVARNMNSSYDEGKIYSLARGFLAIGKSADESAELITRITDASAKLGKGVEFTDMLSDAFKRLATGGELSERQLKALAEAGVDLTDVQDEIRAGGERAYTALYNKLEKYRGGMDATKQTSVQMEADIKANLVEIGRQTALLVDDFFGFSDNLKVFYKWVITTTEAVINSIKRMIVALENVENRSNARMEASAKYEAEMEKKYGDNWINEMSDSEKRTWNERMDNAEKLAKVVTEADKQSNIKPVQSIAKGSVGYSVGSSGGATRGASVKEDDLLKPYIERAKAVETAGRKEQNALKQRQALEIKYQDTVNKNTLSMLEGEQKRIAMFEQEQAMISFKQQLDTTATEAQIENLRAVMSVYEEAKANGIPNSQEHIDIINSEIEALQNELSVRQQITDLMIQTNANTNAVKESTNKLKGIYEQLGGQAINGLASGISDAIMNAKSLGETMSQVAKQMLAEVVQLIAKWLILTALMGVGGGIGDFAKTTRGKMFSVGASTGGLIVGGGTSTSDSIPAMLSNGEFVMNAKAVDRIGVENLQRMNSGSTAVRHFAEGGIVNGGSGKNITLNVSAIDASSFETFLANGAFEKIKSAFNDDAVMFG